MIILQQVSYGVRTAPEHFFQKPERCLHFVSFALLLYGQLPRIAFEIDDTQRFQWRVKKLYD